MQTFYFYLTRKQIVVVWHGNDGRDSRNYPKTEAGERRSIRKLQSLQDAGYTRVDAPRDWFAELVKTARDSKSIV